MTKFNIKNIEEYRTLLETRSVAEIIRNKVSLRQTIDNYFNWLKDKYPAVASSLDSLLKQKELEWNEAIDLQQEERIKVLIFDTLEAPGVGKEIRKQSRQQLEELLNTPQKIDKKPVEDLKIDSQVLYNTSDAVFLVNGLIEEVFLNLIPRELEKELNQEPKVELSELPAEWNTKRDELLSSICAKSIGKIRVLSDLERVEEAINEKYQELIAIVQKIRTSKQETSKQELQKKHDELLKKVQELTDKGKENENKIKDLEGKLTDNQEAIKVKDKQLTELIKLKQTKFEATRKINNYWHNATMIDRGEKEKVLGEKWDEEILKKDTPEKIIEEQNRLVKLIEERVETEKQNQTKFEEELQAKIKAAQDLNSGLTSGDPKELLKELEDYRDKWGTSGQATPAQWNAFRQNRVDLNREIANFSITVSRNEAVNEIRNILGGFRANELLVKEEQIEFERTLRQLQTSKEINEFENNFLTEVIVAKEVRSELMEIAKEAENALKEDQPNKEKCLELHIKLRMYRDSSLKSTNNLILARAVSYNRQTTNLRRLMNRLERVYEQQTAQIINP